jgi:hypothetical protein
MKEFLPYTESLELKEIGFNEPCFKVGNPNGVICWRFMDVVGMEGVGIDNLLEVEFDNRWVEIPTFSQTFHWFRKQHNLESYNAKVEAKKYYLKGFEVAELTESQNVTHEQTMRDAESFFELIYPLKLEI